MRPLGRTAALALAVVALAVQATAASAAAAGDAYRTQLAAAGSELTTALGGLGAVTGMSLAYPVKPDAARRAARRLALVDASLRQVAATLAAMHPPAAVRVEHLRLAKAVTALADQVVPVLKRLRSGYLVAAARLPNLPAVTDVGSAITALRKHGYLG